MRYSYQKVPLKVLKLFLHLLIACAGPTAPVQCQQSVTCDPDSEGGELQVWEAALTEAEARHPV